VLHIKIVLILIMWRKNLYELSCQWPQIKPLLAVIYPYNHFLRCFCYANTSGEQNWRCNDGTHVIPNFILEHTFPDL